MNVYNINPKSVSPYGIQESTVYLSAERKGPLECCNWDPDLLAGQFGCTPGCCHDTDKYDWSRTDRPRLAIPKEVRYLRVLHLRNRFLSVTSSASIVRNFTVSRPLLRCTVIRHTFPGNRHWRQRFRSDRIEQRREQRLADSHVFWWQQVPAFDLLNPVVLPFQKQNPPWKHIAGIDRHFLLVINLICIVKFVLLTPLGQPSPSD